jgi:hypothetical protein
MPLTKVLVVPCCVSLSSGVRCRRAHFASAISSITELRLAGGVRCLPVLQGGVPDGPLFHRASVWEDDCG